MPVLLLDRDGVINEDSDDYIRSVAEWRPIPGSIEAMAELSQAGYRIAVATNQSGLSRGYFGLDELEEIHQHMCSLVEELGGQIDGVFYCPHMPDEGCSCRKPATGMLKAIEEELGETLTGAPFIGDSLKDLQAAQAYGCKPMLVATGKGSATCQQLQVAEVSLNNPQDIPVYDNLAAAATVLLST
jgi:D-glycero-D-manno-heptose 1,7-bisphosphate phosphatase